MRMSDWSSEGVASDLAHGARAVLVSGGFTVFADPVAAEIGFDVAISNTLEIADGRLTGRVLRPVVDYAVKRATLLAVSETLGIELEATLAVGAGANDVPMIAFWRAACSERVCRYVYPTAVAHSLKQQKTE